MLDQIEKTSEGISNHATWHYDLKLVTVQDPSNTTTLLGSLSCLDYEWSPVDDLLALAAGTPADSQGTDGCRDPHLSIINTANGELRRLAEDARVQFGLEWSPDGQWIAYTCYDESHPDPYRHQSCLIANDGMIHTVLLPLQRSIWPRWVTDSELVAVVYDRSLYYLNPEDGSTVNVEKLRSLDAGFHWLGPDVGTATRGFADCGIPCTRRELYASSIKTGESKAILKLYGCFPEAVWSPDTRYVAFAIAGHATFCL
jgi:Tol biopolymer transport system component